MSKKAEIKKIVLDLNGKEIELTIEQAKRLNSLLGDQPPIIIERQRPYWDYPQVTWAVSDKFTASYSAENQTMSISL